jgi:iron complex outermembrane receptor protein
MIGPDTRPRIPRSAFRQATLLVPLLAMLGRGVEAQQPSPSDSVRRDTTRVTRLPDINVSATRSAEPLERVPYATGVLNRGDLQRGQQTVGLDEALNNLPGVVVSNRYNFSLDQRISIRGFGSRSNFGVRGIKILLDGVPQTLPDGQSQLTNVEFANIGRAEVLRGSSSSLYGNASGGVISFQSEPAAAAPFAQRVRVQGGTGKEGNDDFYKWQSWSSGRLGSASGTLSLSQFKADGFREHSGAEVRQLNAGIDYVFSGSTIGTLRFSAADDPRAENPGALTYAEWMANPDSAAASNILRRADKDVQQQQLSLGARHVDPAGNEVAVTVFGVLRDLKNPLAAPPQGGPTGMTIGTYVDIGRVVGGARASATYRLGSASWSPQLTTGADLQRMRDNRQNLVAVSGVPTDSVLIDQREKITEFGPFAQLAWTPNKRFLVSGGVRYDWVRFDVLDRHLSDGLDNSGVRTNAAFSGNIGASWSASEQFVPYVNLSTSFETPTTTELANQPNGTGGFNSALKPQRAVTYEVGARGRASSRVSYSAAFFIGRITDALVQQQEVGGRAFFVNAGKTHNDGAELGLTVTPVDGLSLSGAYTFAHYRFATGDALDGNKLPGVPDHFWRLGLRTNLFSGLYVDADHTISSSLFADDANSIPVDAWGAGVTNLRVGWSGNAGSMQLSPFIGFNNLWDRRYVGSVTINGNFGRVFEPAPGRVVYIGTEIGYRTAAEP